MRYNELRKHYDSAVRANEKLVSHIRKEKQMMKQWMSYAYNSHNGLISKDKLSGISTSSSARDRGRDPLDALLTGAQTVNSFVTSELSHARTEEQGKSIKSHPPAALVPSGPDLQSERLMQGTPIGQVESSKDSTLEPHIVQLPSNETIVPETDHNMEGDHDLTGVANAANDTKHQHQPSEQNNPVSTPISTQGYDVLQMIKQEPSSPRSAVPEIDSDEPVVISERCLKRKREARGEITGYRGTEQGDFKRPFKVKTEHHSSSPLGLNGFQECLQESLDLDEVGRRVETPKKRTRFRTNAAYLPTSTSSRVMAATHDDEHGNLSDSCMGLVPEYDSEHADQSTAGQPNEHFGERTPFRTNSEWGPPQLEAPETTISDTGSIKALNGVTSIKNFCLSTPKRHEDGQAFVGIPTFPGVQRYNDNPDDQIPESCQRPQSNARSANRARALRPMSNNLRLLPPVGSSTSSELSRKKKKTFHSAELKVALVAEDREIQTPVATPRKIAAPTNALNTRSSTPDRSKGITPKPGIQQKLDSLLAKPSPGKLLLAPAVVGSKSPRPEFLRARPLQHLNLEHFKVNPNYNQGLDYAFTETVRNKELRKCLPGCTRPDCCGSTFRKSIEIAGLPTPQRSELRWDSSQSMSEDEQLLHAFVGDDVGRLKNATEAERKEFLLQARTKQFADKHGKHRHAYERRKTPPGFWRTDMPSTQELERDKEEATRMEREEVETRYREAMRPGGRWIFRDE